MTEYATPEVINSVLRLGGLVEVRDMLDAEEGTPPGDRVAYVQVWESAGHKAMLVLRAQCTIAVLHAAIDLTPMCTWASDLDIARRHGHVWVSHRLAAAALTSYALVVGACRP